MLCTLAPSTKLILKILGSETYITGNTVAKITEFNLWNYEMSENELNSKTCGTKGNVVSWDSLKERGSANRTAKSFPKCNGNILKINILTSSDFLFIDDAII